MAEPPLIKGIFARLIADRDKDAGIRGLAVREELTGTAGNIGDTYFVNAAVEEVGPTAIV
jgi:hypothetical protein